LCRERVEELEPSIRYCLHKIGQSNLQASELLQIGDVEGPALDLFKAKLEVGINFFCMIGKKETSNIYKSRHSFGNVVLRHKIDFSFFCSIGGHNHVHIHRSFKYWQTFSNNLPSIFHRKIQLDAWSRP